MLEAAQKTVFLTANREREDVARDDVLLLALTHLLEIVGEAARNVSLASQERYSDIPWRQISATRNRLVHGYDEVDLTVLWDIIENNLPSLIADLEGIIASIDD